MYGIICSIHFPTSLVIQTLQPCMPFLLPLSQFKQDFYANMAPCTPPAPYPNFTDAFPISLGSDILSYTVFAVVYIHLASFHYSAVVEIQIVHFPLPLKPSILGTAFLPTLLPATSALGTPWMVLGSFIRLTSSCAGILDTTVL